MPRPPIREAAIGFSYVLAGNGVFLQAKRTDGIEALIPVSSCEIRGLPKLTPYLRWPYPRVGSPIVLEMLALAQAARNQYGQRIEILFHLLYDDQVAGWKLVVPEQEQGVVHVRPLENGSGQGHSSSFSSFSSYSEAIVECHSHHQMAAFFSATDNADESGFRLFAVIGRVATTQPQMRVRVGVYRYFYELPASQIFEIPSVITDCHLDAALAVNEAYQSEEHGAAWGRRGSRSRPRIGNKKDDGRGGIY